MLFFFWRCNDFFRINKKIFRKFKVVTSLLYYQKIFHGFILNRQYIYALLYSAFNVLETAYLIIE